MKEKRRVSAKFNVIFCFRIMASLSNIKQGVLCRCPYTNEFFCLGLGACKIKFFEIDSRTTS